MTGELGMKAMAQRIARLEDLEAIRALVASYGPLADSGDAQAVAQLWAPEGSYGVGAFGTAQGHEAIAGLIESQTHQGLLADGCAHLLGPVAIDLAGDKAIARGHSIVFRHEGQGRFEVYRVSANRWELERHNGGWRVSHRENALLDGDEAARTLLNPPAALHRS